MRIGNAMEISASGLSAERFRMDVIAANIANAATTSQPGGPEAYRRRIVTVAGGPDGVRVTGIMPDDTPLRAVYDPEHPDAIDGFVYYSNVQPVEEMVNMITATRAYEANLAAFNAAKSMIRSALNIGRI